MIQWNSKIRQSARPTTCCPNTLQPVGFCRINAGSVPPFEDMNVKLLTQKQLAEIREHYKNRCAELLEKGLTPADCDDDLEMIGQLSDHITALEAESASLMLAIDNGQEWSDCDEAALIVKLQSARATITTLEAEIESARKVIALYERDIPLLTRGMEFHPKGWEHLCECQMCMSYEQGQG